MPGPLFTFAAYLGAVMRPEVAGIVMQLLKDNGEPVKRGDLLVRLAQMVGEFEKPRYVQYED